MVIMLHIVQVRVHKSVYIIGLGGGAFRVLIPGELCVKNWASGDGGWWDLHSLDTGMQLLIMFRILVVDA